MRSERNIDNAPRILGAMFLTVIVTSILGGELLNAAAGSGGISDILMNISKNLTLMRMSILADMANSLGIIALAALLYIVLNKQNKIMALIAFGSWLAEAIFCALSKIGALALIPLSVAFVKAGAPADSYYQALGDFLYAGVTKQAYTTHMFFYSFGGILWYYMFYKSKYVPRAISLLGLIAAPVSLAGIVFEYLGYAVPMFVHLPLLPFELMIGFWLLIKGIRIQERDNLALESL